MTTTSLFDIVPIWERLNRDLVRLVDSVPDDKLDWSPTPEMWSFRRLFWHLTEAREQWMTRGFNDGLPNISSDQNPSKERIRDLLGSTWQRVSATAADQAKLDATYKDLWWDKAPLYTGHWIVFHLLEHDIHHRAEMFFYLTLLELPVSQTWTA